MTGYLTNAGDETTETDDLELEVKAHQADSNIVADAAAVDLSAVEPGETATPTATLEVAQEYEYYLDAILWLDGTIVATDRTRGLARTTNAASGPTRSDAISPGPHSGCVRCSPSSPSSSSTPA